MNRGPDGCRAVAEVHHLNISYKYLRIKDSSYFSNNKSGVISGRLEYDSCPSH